MPAGPKRKRSEPDAHPAMPSWRLRSSGEHFTDFSLPVKWRIFRRLQKAFSKQSLLPLFTASDVCSSPAADAYFTHHLRAWQALRVKKFHAGVITLSWVRSLQHPPHTSRLYCAISTALFQTSTPYLIGAASRPVLSLAATPPEAAPVVTKPPLLRLFLAAPCLMHLACCTLLDAPSLLRQLSLLRQPWPWPSPAPRLAPSCYPQPSSRTRLWTGRRQAGGKTKDARQWRASRKRWSHRRISRAASLWRNASCRPG